jgi:hypothetical protein
MPRKPTNGLREGCVATRKGLAAALGVASATIYHWSGMPREADGSYNVEAVRQWRQERSVRPALKRKGLELPTAAEIDESLKALALAKDQVAALCESSFEVADIFRDNRLNVLTAQQAKTAALARTILETFDEETVKTLKPGDRIRLLYTLTWCFGVNFDKERLEKDQSTENVAVMVKEIQRLQRERWAEQAAERARIAAKLEARGMGDGG